MASGRLRIGYTAPGTYILVAETGAYSLLGQTALLNYSNIPVQAAQEWSGLGAEIQRWMSPTASGSGDGLSIGNPWTYAQAEAGAANLTVGMLPGVYQRGSTSSNSIPAFRIPSGTFGTTRFVAQWPAAYFATNRSEFRNGVTTGISGCVTIGVQGANNAQIIGAYVNEDVSRSVADTAPMNIVDSTNGALIACRVDSIPLFFNPPQGDNKNGIRIERATNAVVRNCLLNGVTQPTSASQNHAGIMLYDSLGHIIENNEIFNCDVGIYVKGTHGLPLGGGIIRKNWIYDCVYRGITVGGPNTDASLSENVMEQNLIVNCPYSVVFNSFDGVSPSEVWFRNNTIVGGAALFSGAKYAFVFQGPGGANSYRDMRFYNNLIKDHQNLFRMGFDGEFSAGTMATVNAQMTSVTNLRNYNVGRSLTFWARMADTNKNLATWQIDSGASAGVRWDLNSQELSADPFVGGGTQPQHFKLNAVSGGGLTAVTAGNTGGAVGCFVTGSENIGRQP